MDYNLVVAKFGDKQRLMDAKFTITQGIAKDSKESVILVGYKKNGVVLATEAMPKVEFDRRVASKHKFLNGRIFSQELYDSLGVK